MLGGMRGGPYDVAAFGVVLGPQRFATPALAAAAECSCGAALEDEAELAQERCARCSAEARQRWEGRVRR